MAEPAAELHAEGHPRDRHPDRLDDGMADLGSERERLDDLLLVRVIDQRTVGADSDASVSGRLGDRAHPLGWAAGRREHDCRASVLNRGEGASGPVGDRPVGAEEPSVQVTDDESRRRGAEGSVTAPSFQSTDDRQRDVCGHESHHRA